MEARNERLLERAEARRAEILERLARLESGSRSDHAAARGERLDVGARLRTLVLPALAILLLVQLGSRGGGLADRTLGASAAFVPGPGAAFVGARSLEPGDHRTRHPVAPGDVVGVLTGEAGELTLSGGALWVQPGARVLVASLFPPRARLLVGAASARGAIRVETAHGIVELASGEARLSLDQTGLSVELRDGQGELIGPDATVGLTPGRPVRSR